MPFKLASNEYPIDSLAVKDQDPEAGIGGKFR
jgi:hypothetical protein